MKKIIAQNKKARFDYEILDTIEVGIVLKGFEVKSIRGAKVSIKESYAKIINNELWLVGVNINRYKQYTGQDYDPTRSRKLLVNKSELKKMIGKVNEKGLAIVPLDLYILNNKLVKLTLAVARGKKKFDKRETIKKREVDRDIRRKFRG